MNFTKDEMYMIERWADREYALIARDLLSIIMNKQNVERELSLEEKDICKEQILEMQRTMKELKSIREFCERERK